MNTKYVTPILLIEDNPGDAKLVSVYLNDAAMKCDLRVAESYLDAKEILQNNKIDIVLLDLNLPDSQGFKTLTRYLDEFDHIPVIVLTGTNNEIIGNQSIRAGAQDFLVKGQLEGKLLGRAIRYALHRYKTQLELEAQAKQFEINEKRFVSAQAMGNFGNWEMDIVSNKMKWTNEVCRMFGFKEGENDRTFSEYMNYVHNEDKEGVEAFFERAGKDGKLYKHEHRIVIDGKNIRYLSIQGKVNYDELTEKFLLIGVMQDITERKITEQLIIDKNITSKAQSIKEEALEDLGFNIRTPLASVIQMMYLLEDTRTNLQQKDYIGGMKTSIDDLSIAVNNLLNFSVLVSDSVKVEEEVINIEEFSRGIEQVLKLKAENDRLDLVVKIDPNFPAKIKTDGRKITQVLFNLIDNAIKFNHEGGKINVNITPKNIGTNKMDMVFTIQDTGKGMPASQIKRLMNADRLLEVYSDKDDKNKRPLGVAIVAKITKTLGGEMLIDSKVNEGSTFTITIPVKTVQESVVISANEPEAPLKILLVEDHFLTQMGTRKILTNWSNFVSVDIADNGYVGVEKYREHGYDLILMDIQMPVMSGIEAAKKIRQTSDVPIIALTANSTKQEQDKCFTAGMNDYLQKPYQPKELQSRIMKLISFVMN